MKNPEYAGFDPAVIPLVRYFNAAGLATVLSCQGHPEEAYMHLFWIEFARAVDEKAIAAFQRRHAVPDHGFVARGMFCKRLGFGDADGNMEPYASYRYVAASPEDAAADLEAWQEDDDRLRTLPDWKSCHPGLFHDAMQARRRQTPVRDMPDGVLYVLYTRWRDDVASGAYQAQAAKAAIEYRDALEKECSRRGIPYAKEE